MSTLLAVYSSLEADLFDASILNLSSLFSKNYSSYWIYMPIMFNLSDACIYLKDGKSPFFKIRTKCIFFNLMAIRGSHTPDMAAYIFWNCFLLNSVQFKEGTIERYKINLQVFRLPMTDFLKSLMLKKVGA